MMGPGPVGPDEISNVAGYIDTTGSFWNQPEGPTPDFSSPYIFGHRWREVVFDLMLDEQGQLVAVDLRAQLLSSEVLGVIYRVDDTNGDFAYQVGDQPGVDEDNRILIPGETEAYYRMKLIKVPENRKEEFSFFYVLRNIYSLGGSNIDVNSFDLRIERNIIGDNTLDLDESEIPYIQIFGLDQYNSEYSPTPDGMVDWNNELLFDMRNGLLRFPLSFPTPFNAGEAAYAEYAGDSGFEWEGTYLQSHQAPALYSVDELSFNYNDHGHFRIVVTLSTSENSP